MPEPRDVSKIPSLSHSISLLFFPLSSRPSSHGDSWHFQAYILHPSSISFSLTHSSNIPGQSFIGPLGSQTHPWTSHCGHKEMEEADWSNLDHKATFGLRSEEEEKSSIHPNHMYQPRSKNDSPIIKQGIHLQEGELYWDGKTNNCSLTPVHLLG